MRTGSRLHIHVFQDHWVRLLFLFFLGWSSTASRLKPTHIHVFVLRHFRHDCNISREGASTYALALRGNNLDEASVSCRSWQQNKHFFSEVWLIWKSTSISFLSCQSSAQRRSFLKDLSLTEIWLGEAAFSFYKARERFCKIIIA